MKQNPRKTARRIKRDLLHNGKRTAKKMLKLIDEIDARPDIKVAFAQPELVRGLQNFIEDAEYELDIFTPIVKKL